MKNERIVLGLRFLWRANEDITRGLDGIQTPGLEPNHFLYPHPNNFPTLFHPKVVHFNYPTSFKNNRTKRHTHWKGNNVLIGRNLNTPQSRYTTALILAGQGKGGHYCDVLDMACAQVTKMLVYLIIN